MRLDYAGGREIFVPLSRRNLETLLAKLDGNPPDSACTLLLEGLDHYLVITAETNEEHYRSRNPGPMHPTTELALGGR